MNNKCGVPYSTKDLDRWSYLNDTSYVLRKGRVGGKLTMMAIVMISMIMWMSNDMLTQGLLRDGPWWCKQ